jgi:hypothetical protein
MAELVDALVLGTNASAWEFESLYPHHKQGMAAPRLRQSASLWDAGSFGVHFSPLVFFSGAG